MFRHEIDSLFTKKVADYIAAGYVINSNTMSGSQGEIGKIDLRNGETYIRIMLDTTYSWKDGDKINLIVGRITDKVYPVGHCTVWNQNLEVLESQSFVKLSENWYILPEEYPAISEKQQARAPKHYEHCEQIDFSDSAKKVVLSYLRRQPKCASIRLGEIQSVYKKVSTSVFSGKTTIAYCIKARETVFTLSRKEV